ncbi:MAG TPA: hypothetical protein VJL61_05840 [Rhodanobacteraceae bacterium]|nr:hypothetical protein [Rhodanobacteraceae bacterium]
MRDNRKILMQKPSAAAGISAACATPTVRHDPGIFAPGVFLLPLNTSRHRRT